MWEGLIFFPYKLLSFMEKREEELVASRLAVIQLAQSLGSISEACRRAGMDRTSFYAWKKRYEAFGNEGLKDRPPVHKYHPQTTPQELVKRIRSCAESNPGWGASRISRELKSEGEKISPPTIQKILNQSGLGNVQAGRREIPAGKGGSQDPVIQKVDLCFKERCLECDRPGQLLLQDTLLIGNFKDLGPIYMQTVIDPYSSYAFAFLHTDRHARFAVRMLHQEILPFFQKKGLKIETIITGLSQEFCSKKENPFLLYLGLHGIQHEKKSVKSLKKNGFIQHFLKTAKEEFFKPREKKGGTLEALQAELSSWLRDYNFQQIKNGKRGI